MNSSRLLLSVCICIYEFYSIKPSHFTETKIYVKLDPKAVNTAHSYNLKSGTIIHNGIIYLKKLRNNRQGHDKIMEKSRRKQK